MIAPLYIEVKNLSYLLVSSRWNDGDNDIEVDSYSDGSKIVKKVLIILSLILIVSIMTAITVVDVVIAVLDVVKHVLDIVTPFINHLNNKLDLN